ncbi:energy-coupling factor ABC transporter ATP-binding protein [Jeotgalibacillus proteolyticus]|uniref:Energy-coupling factor ABC transporter ATP-binding protein n=1 Tax=Jeotgalibacillus proteolyticus TaxID=2082395 RepID=A0A2S5G6S8_9BACL|nr:energy-coupling factor ABC transporter ATP-binding protein [Jeotgalibacillus proteolyticus]PPA68631.1 energy-coupling factor ABC transporter ATP-binding protein [Jeotgalibacillus proteolyticus]
MSREVISLDSITFHYPGSEQQVLKNVSFSVREGEWVAIVGHNGSGKSTLAKLMNGLYFPKAGSIHIAGKKLEKDTVWETRKHIGMVFQNPDNQFVGTTVQDDVAFGLENHGVPHEDMVRRVHSALRQVKMDDFLNQEPHHLSGGQKQRVAMASVLALQPDIIILDEATSMLDPTGRQEVISLVRALKQEQEMTVLSITHDLEEAAKADRLIVMNQGEVYRTGTPEEIFELGDELVSLGLDLPFPIKMGNALKAQGVPVQGQHLTEEELVNELWTSHFKK